MVSNGQTLDDDSSLLHAVCRPMLSALRSFSMVHVHDCLARPGLEDASSDSVKTPK